MESFLKFEKIKICDEYFIYLSNKEDCKFGYIHYVFYLEEKEVIISYIFIKPNYRKNGYGKLLFKEFFKHIIEIMQTENIKTLTIHLDDMSDRYGQSDNLYLKMGFKYYEEINGTPLAPEMYLILK